MYCYASDFNDIIKVEKMVVSGVLPGRSAIGEEIKRRGKPSSRYSYASKPPIAQRAGGIRKDC